MMRQALVRKRVPILLSRIRGFQLVLEIRKPIPMVDALDMFSERMPVAGVLVTLQWQEQRLVEVSPALHRL